MENIQDIVKRISNLDMQLTEKEIENILPTFGMNNEGLGEMPTELNEFYGKGIKFWQYPNQFSKLLKHISNIKINSYLEIGCRWGGTFIIMNEILNQNNKNLNSYACDLNDMSDILKEYQNIRSFQYYCGDSHSTPFKLSIPHQIDFVFIDGDHSYNGLKQDYEFALSLNPKWIMLHDIYSDACGDVSKFWQEITPEYQNTFEFIDQYPSVAGNYLGIGLIQI